MHSLIYVCLMKKLRKNWNEDVGPPPTPEEAQEKTKKELKPKRFFIKALHSFNNLKKLRKNWNIGNIYMVIEAWWNFEKTKKELKPNKSN